MAEEFKTYNAAKEFVDRHRTSPYRDKPAFVDPARSLTYGELAETTDRFANLFTACAIPTEARVALLMLDTISYPPAFWGAIKAGIVPVPLNTLLTTEQYGYILADSRARAVVVSAPLLPAIKPLLGKLPHLKHVFVDGGEVPAFALDLAAELAAQPTTFEAVATNADETAFWLYSSGSTGMPKGTRHIHLSLMSTAKLYGQGIIDIRPDDIVYSAAKIFFAYGLGNAMSFPLSVGATTILLPDRPTPDAVFALLKKYQPTLFFGVPTLYAAMLNHPKASRDESSSRLRMCISAGEPLPEEVGKAWRERFGVDILDGIGSTEMLHIFVSNTPGDVRYGTSGKPVPGYAVRIVDENDRDLQDGEIGELLVSGPSSADGYWNQREKTRRTFQGPWTRSGDKYTRSADGYFTYQGRTDDMFKVSGIWCSPFEVESALISHDAVLEAAVVAKEDGDGLVKPRAFVVLKSGIEGGDALVRELQEHVKAKAGPWKYPRWITFAETLPKTATGKIQRFKLRDM
ncbi:MAG TPA: benzoate-CoA ligase family protein [Hyphomicrobiaceae bacterium]|nr:benzoate-CoA ligase family protein [Hyphomicrobiaceae bacterium]